MLGGVPFCERGTCSIKVGASKDQWIGFGAIDPNDSNNWINYYGWNGVVAEANEGKAKGVKFGKGDKVVLTTDLNNCTMTWVVNGKYSVSYKS